MPSTSASEPQGRPGGAGAGLVDHWRPLLGPFLAGLVRREQQEHAARYVAGLLSTLPNKTTETIAGFFDQPRHGLQHFLGASNWDWSPMLAELTRQVEDARGEADGVLSLDLVGFPKKGDASVGVERQSVGLAHTQTNCQVAVYLGYTSRGGAAVFDVRLYLPWAWARDRPRRKRCGVPTRLGYQSRAQLAAQMLRRREGLPPYSWVVAAPTLGQFQELRQALAEGGHRYLACIPPSTPIRSLEAGARAPLLTAEELGASLAGSLWAPTQTGHRAWEVATISATQGSRRLPNRETLVVLRRPDPTGATMGYYLSNHSAGLPVEEWRRVAAAIPSTADYLRAAIRAAGLGSYEIRTWVGWYHHQVLSLVAAWLLQRAQSGQAALPVAPSPFDEGPRGGPGQIPPS